MSSNVQRLIFSTQAIIEKCKKNQALSRPAGDPDVDEGITGVLN